MKLKTYSGDEVREHRRRLGLKQSEFWSSFHITQSGGSRYESGREIPEPVQILLNIALGTEAKASAAFAALRVLAKPSKKTK